MNMDIYTKTFQEMRIINALIELKIEEVTTSQKLIKQNIFCRR
jgi:hypothetical protein